MHWSRVLAAAFLNFVSADEITTTLSTTSSVSSLPAATTAPLPAIPPTKHDIKMTSRTFDSPIIDFFYFPKTATIMILDSKRLGFVSNDEGNTWTSILQDSGPVLSIVKDVNYASRAFALTADAVWVTEDGGSHFESMQVPNSPDISMVSDFIVSHPKNKEWLIWIGSSGCDATSSACHTEAFVSWNLGKSWATLTTYAQSCIWGTGSTFKSVSDRTIFCGIFEPKSGSQRSLVRLTLQRSDNGDSNFTPILDINGFALVDDYLIAAVPTTDSKDVQVHVSLDGVNFAQAAFPNTGMARDGYTVLESSTGNVFIHMIESTRNGGEYGSIMKSNWNGTYYHSAIDGVNQNRNGYVDFEKLEGLNGTMIANRITNLDAVTKGSPKEIQTLISYNDGILFF